MTHKADVIFMGHLSPIRLNEVISSALAMVYISYFEGFGIPIVEAFKSQTAVITSNVTSMPEVAGDAALIVDPFDISDIAKAMNIIESNPDIRKQLIKKGADRVKQFSWNHTAEAVWDSITKCINTKTTN